MFATLLNDLWQSNTIFSLKRVLESAQHCGQKETPSTCWSHPTSSSQVALIRGHPTGCGSPLTWHGFPRTSSTAQRECRASNLRLSPHQCDPLTGSEPVLENPRVTSSAFARKRQLEPLVLSSSHCATLIGEHKRTCQRLQRRQS